MKGNATAVNKVYFQFEEDFMENGIRCIPMIVRFNLDACGVKLKLAEWSRLNKAERDQLASADCGTPSEIADYRERLLALIRERTGNQGSVIPLADNPAWARMDEIPYSVEQKISEHGANISLRQWQQLAPLQRFALLKLSHPGHENKNFPKAMEEFGLMLCPP